MEKLFASLSLGTPKLILFKCKIQNHNSYIMEETKMADRHYHHHHWHRGGSDNSGMGCLVMIILGLVAMPLVGLYMLFHGDDDGQKAIGAILTIVGIIIWIAVAQG